MIQLKGIIINYFLFILGLSVLLFLPLGWYHLLYLHGVSFIFGFLGKDSVKFYVLLAEFRNVAHNIWPFLTINGCSNFETSVHNVLCHIVMMFVCYYLIKDKRKTKSKKKQFKILTVVFLTGLILNCTIAHLITHSQNYYLHFMFRYTTIFQAISTGYWVSTMLWFNNHEHKHFIKHWIGWIVLISLIWSFYETTVSISINFELSEAVFTVCTWIAVLNNRYKKRHIKID